LVRVPGWLKAMAKQPKSGNPMMPSWLQSASHRFPQSSASVSSWLGFAFSEQLSSVSLTPSRSKSGLVPANDGVPQSRHAKVATSSIGLICFSSVDGNAPLPMRSSRRRIGGEQSVEVRWFQCRASADEDEFGGGRKRAPGARFDELGATADLLEDNTFFLQVLEMQESLGAKDARHGAGR
jgi:hypothetical protein